MKKILIPICVVATTLVACVCYFSLKKTSDSSISSSGLEDISNAGKSNEPNVFHSKVYFTQDISPEGLLKVYSKVSKNIGGRVVIKFHSGEPKGPNLIPREMVKALYDAVPNSTLADTNTLYKGARYTTEEHRKTIHINGWDEFAKVDILDEEGTVNFPVKGGRHFKEVSMGGHLANYDSMIVLTHFKGHTMGGFGGSIKNIAIGCADGRVGKKQVHAVTAIGTWPKGEGFMENMVESAKAVVDHFAPRIVYLNVLRRISIDCDCVGTYAEEPKVRDIGILASDDIVAVDQASIDLVYKLPEKEVDELKERIESRKGLHQLKYGAQIGLGSREYQLEEIN